MRAVPGLLTIFGRAGIEGDQAVCRLKRLHVERDISTFQVHDDREGLSKIEELTKALRREAGLPPTPGERVQDGLVYLHDG